MRIAIAGTGRVGSCLAYSCHLHGFEIVAVISRQAADSQHLATQVQASAFTYGDLPDQLEADCLFLAVPDDHIDSIGQFMSSRVSQGCTIVHHSGATPLLDIASRPHGVLWPIYSISKETILQHTLAPLIVDGSSDDVIRQLTGMAASLTGQTAVYDHQGRTRLHLAASMGNNLVDHLLNQVFAHLVAHDLDPLLIGPLVKDSITRRFSHRGPGVLTGPASRQDYSTMDRHRQLLAETPSLLKIYDVLSEDILHHLSQKREE